MATTVKPARPQPGYDEDLVGWAEAQARALRERRFELLDVENVAEEIEDVARSEARAVRSHLETLLLHLLKWRCQPERRSRSWRATIRVARNSIAHDLRDSPSLVPRLPAMIARVYPNARVRAGAETDKGEEVFPETCPFTLEQVTGDWLPEDEGAA